MFEIAADMVRMCPALSRRVKLLASTKRLIYLPTNSFIMLSAEVTQSTIQHTWRVSDEPYTQPDRKLFDVTQKVRRCEDAAAILSNYHGGHGHTKHLLRDTPEGSGHY